MGGKRIAHTVACCKAVGYLWYPTVTVNGTLVYTGKGYLSFSKALREAREYVRLMTDRPVYKRWERK